MTPQEYLAIARRRWRWIVAGLVVGLAVAAGVTVLVPREYSATSTIHVSARPVGADAAAVVAADELSSKRMTTYVELLRSGKLAAEVARELGPDAPADLADRISVSNLPETVLLTATVTDRSPLLASRIANLVADRFVANVALLEQPPDPVTPPLLTARIFQAASPPARPTSPVPLVNFTLGALLGLLLGVVLALVRNAQDTSITSPERLRGLLGIPVLGSLGQTGERGGRSLVVRSAPRTPEAEAYRRLRVNLVFADTSGDPKAVLITSAGPGEGKTSTLCNLAIALADAGWKVLVVEADLRHPEAADLFGLDPSVGLTTVLAERAPLDQVVQSWEGELDVVASGPIPDNPSELLESAELADFLEEARTKYDIVLIDASPLGPVADGAAVAARADGVLLVVRHGRTTAREVRAAKESLDAVSARLLGAVLTMVPPRAMRSHSYVSS